MKFFAVERLTFWPKGQKVSLSSFKCCCIYYLNPSYQRLKNPNESIQYTDRTIKLFKETTQPELTFMALLHKITQLNKSKKLNEANEVEKEAKAIIANSENFRDQAFLNFFMGYFMNTVQNKKAIGFEYLLKADYELEKMGEKNLRIRVLEVLGFEFDHVGMYQKAADYFKKAIAFRNETKRIEGIAVLYLEVVFELVPLKKLNEAKQYLEKAKVAIKETKNNRDRLLLEARIPDAAGQIWMGEGKYQEALKVYLQANKIAKDLNDDRLPMYFNSYIAQCFQKLGDIKNSILYGEKSYNLIQKNPNAEQWLKINTSLLLSEVYDETGQSEKAFEYLKKYKNYVKEKEEQDIANLSTNLAIENFTQKNEQEKAAFEKEKLIIEHENRNQRWWLFSIAAALLSSFVFLYFLFRTNQNKQKANNLLSRQKEEINLQKHKAENALSQLKSTQAQLIQSEKMASLGELTAGIAHEIQNPLNFVNNFSEVTEELVEELEEEGNKENGERDKGLEKELINDIKENLKKIHHHGNRASSIVKGMLEHSRTSSGKKELTDINALADEYLRLAYHGLRAKDKDFNAVPIAIGIETHLDPNLPKIEVIPQEIGRVLLNLINNAFQATMEEGTRRKEQGDLNYKPKVSITTQLITNNQSQITIKDNGPGIPDAIKDKIFQPFFTTKDTGKGTGLGLSLAYDIVKAHGGELTVESEIEIGTVFKIILPLK
jgi:two-component system, NtrC family, sensor kinase